MISKSTIFKIVLNTIIGLVLVFVWLKFVDIDQIWETIKTVSPLSLLPVAFFMLASPIIRAIRLKFFLKPIKQVKVIDLVFLNGASILFNFFIPIRAGEVLKGVYLNNRYQIPVAKSLVLILIDRFIDFLVVLGGSAILLLVVPTSLSMTFIIIIAVINILLLAAAYFLAFKPNFAKKLANFLRSFLILNIIKKYFDKVFDFFLENFSILRRTKADLSFLVALTVLAYAADAAIWYVMFLSFNSPQSFLAMYLAQILSALTYLIPAAPGYVGSAEASGVLVLTGILGIDKNLSSSLVVLFHILTAALVLIFGLISLYFLKVNIREIWKFKGKRG